jgi:hypothetical protein
VREPALVGARTTDAYSTVLTAGYRSAVRQGRGRVTAVPPDDEGIGGGPILKAARQQSRLFIPGVEPVPENWPVGRRIGNPGNEPRAIRPGGRISTHNIRRAGYLIDQ